MLSPAEVDKILFRCSGLSDIMTNYDSDVLTKGHITVCQSKHREIVWERSKQISSKYLEKGILMEPDAITLVSRVNKVLLKKNTERLSNNWITGEPDVYIGEEIRLTKKGYDTKCSWDWTTFPYQNTPLQIDYEWQNHGYMALTGADEWVTAFCLLNNSAKDIRREKEKVWYNLDNPEEQDKDGVINPLYQQYMDACIEIEKNMIYDMAQFRKDNPRFDIDCQEWRYDIPKEDRLREYVVKRDELKIARIYYRVEQCRTYIKENLIQ